MTQAYWQRQKRGSIPMAMLIQVLCNIHLDTEQRREPFSLDEVLGWLGFPTTPVPHEPERPRTPAELEAQVELLHAMYMSIQQTNGQVKG